MRAITRAVWIMIAGAMAAGGCATPAQKAGPHGVAFDRPDPGSLPAAVRQWKDENARRLGTHTRDEGNRTYVLVAWGEKRTGGYAVRIEEIARGRGGDVVVVRLTAPGPDQMVTQAITYPSDLVVTREKLRRPVRFTYSGDLTLTSPLPGPRAPEQKEPQAATSKNFVVTAPTSGSVITSPVRIAGRARVFEATFNIEIEDGHNVLARETVTASAGGPEWGTFDVTLPFASPTSPAGAILFVTYSARDGSRQEELILPVRFAPQGS